MKYIILILSLLSVKASAKFTDRELCNSLLEKTKVIGVARGFGTSENKNITAYLVKEMEKHNLVPAGNKKRSVYTQEFKARDAFGKMQSGSNVIGIIGKGDPEVLLMAHFDSLGSYPYQCRGNTSCLGVTDNATSVALILSIIPELKKYAKSSIGIVLFNAEELQQKDIANGSKYFIKNPTFPLKKVKLVINLDILGTSAYKALDKDYMALGAETGGKNLKNDVMGASVNKILRIRNFSYVFGHRRSDHTHFVKKGIPAIFFTDSDSMVYHNTKDSLDRVDFRKVREAAKLVSDLAIRASNPQRKYKFVKPKKFFTVHIPTYKDMYNFIFLLKDTELEVGKLERATQNKLKKSLDRMLDIYKKGEKKISLKDRKEFAEIATHYLLGSTNLPTGRSCL